MHPMPKIDWPEIIIGCWVSCETPGESAGREHRPKSLALSRRKPILKRRKRA
jgi:hypothetical protein